MANLLSQLGDLVFYLKLGQISKEYFGFSRAWIYQRINGYDGNGNECSLTPEQLQTFKEALHDIARKTDETADKL